MDVDDQNDDTLDEGKNAKAYAGSAGNNAQDANDEIEMLDETEQDEFQIIEAYLPPFWNKSSRKNVTCERRHPYSK